MTVRALRELAKKHLGPGYSRLKTKTELIAELAKSLAEAKPEPTKHPAERQPTQAALKSASNKGVSSAQAVAAPPTRRPRTPLAKPRPGGSNRQLLLRAPGQPRPPPPRDSAEPVPVPEVTPSIVSSRRLEGLTDVSNAALATPAIPKQAPAGLTSPPDVGDVAKEKLPPGACAPYRASAQTSPGEVPGRDRPRE